MAAQETQQGSSGSGSGGAGASVDMKIFYGQPGRVRVSVAAKGAFTLTESFSTDDGTTWLKFKRTASATLASPSTDRGNVVDLTDFILHPGHKFTFDDTSSATNPFDYSIGFHDVEAGV
jgi:hypothetical protein